MWLCGCAHDVQAKVILSFGGSFTMCQATGHWEYTGAGHRQQGCEGCEGREGCEDANTARHRVEGLDTSACPPP